MNNDLFDEKSWNAFCDTLRDAGQTVLDSAPECELDRVEGFRYLSRLTSHALERFNSKENPTNPLINYNAPRIGGYNPDFIYGSARISGKFDYVIHGHREQVYNVGFGSYYGGLGSGGGLQCSGYLLLNDLEIAPDGSFEIQVSRHKKTGNWLPLLEESSTIMIRQTVLDRGADTPASLTIRCLNGSDVETPPEPLRAEAFDKSLEMASLFIRGVLWQFLQWTNTFKANPNQILPLDPALNSSAQGDPNTRYYNGYFELSEGNVLEVELKPPECEYWNLQVTNYWLEPMDFVNHQTHYNNANARVDKDGVVRIYISKFDPGLPNWIDTADHDRGCIFLRWIKAEHDGEVRTRVLNRESLPLKETD